MSYAILVRDLEPASTNSVLARDLIRKEEAADLARRIATSYPNHGFNAARRVYWFSDRSGQHEIWAE